MDELETNAALSSAIDEVLPDLSDPIKRMLEETLGTLGVEKKEDLSFIEEADLLSVLRPIQARKLTAAWKQTARSVGAVSSSPSVEAVCPSPSVFSSPSSTSSSPVPSSNSPRPPETPSSASSYRPRPAVDWVDCFQVPWNKFPHELIQALKREIRPSPRLRREMVRIVVTDMLKVSAKPTKKDSTEVAKKIVAKYPKSFQDVLEGDVIGPGYYSLGKQVQARVENEKRSTTPKIRHRQRACTSRRSSEHDNSDTDEIPAEERALVQDTYGCVAWELKFMPLNETEESQQKKKGEMKVLSETADWSPDKVKTLMKITYYSQRKDINKGTSVERLIQEWPFLAQELGIQSHFEDLTGIALKETFLHGVDKKGKRLLNFMRSVGADKNKRVLQAVTKLQVTRGQLQGCSEDVKDMVLLLLSYFDEKEENLFHYEDETCLGNEVPVENLPGSCCIIVCGTSCYTAGRFMLSVDKVVVNDAIPCFISAITMMFGSFYVFNLHYPVELASTLEFLQRCFFLINPERGTKVEAKKKRLSVNPRVFTLITELSDYEWRE